MNTVDPHDAFSTPSDAPLVPTFPFRFRDVVILTAFYRPSRRPATSPSPTFIR